MTFFSRSLTAAAVVLTTAGAAYAAPKAYTLDKSHTAVTFTVDHLGFSLTHGFFTEFDADIMYDPEDPEKSSVTFTINPKSVNTLWEARDKHVRGKDFLDVENHDAIVFKSSKIEMIDDDTAKLTGDLTILDQTKEETFEVTLRKSAPSPFKKTRVVTGFSISGEIDRTEYGVNYAAGAVGNVIPLKVELEIYPTEE